MGPPPMEDRGAADWVSVSVHSTYRAGVFFFFHVCKYMSVHLFSCLWLSYI